MRTWSGLAVVVALGLGGCEMPSRDQSGYPSESAQDELIDDQEEERIRREQEQREQQMEGQGSTRPSEQAPDLWHGPEEEVLGE